MKWVLGLLFFQMAYANTSHFSKSIDQNQLLSMASLDPSALALYIQKQGVSLLYMPLAPISVQKEWKNYFEVEGVLGKYFANLNGRPTILVVDLDDKWTLMHEFMHYLFEKDRLCDDSEYDEYIIEAQANTRQDFIDASSAFRNQTLNSEKHLTALIELFAEYVDLEMKISIMLSLEEVVIEKMISDMYRNQTSSHLKASSYKSAQSYIKSNANRFKAYLQTFFDIAKELNEKRPGDPTLAKAVLQLSSFQNEIDALLE